MENTISVGYISYAHLITEHYFVDISCLMKGIQYYIPFQATCVFLYDSYMSQ